MQRRLILRSCVIVGWVACAAGEPTPCGDHPADTTCPTDRCSTVTGLRPAEACIAERARFCVEGVDHDDLVTPGLDPDGDRWIFGSTTLPDGWTEAERGDDDVFDWPDCG